MIISIRTFVITNILHTYFIPYEHLHTNFSVQIFTYIFLSDELYPWRTFACERFVYEHLHTNFYAYEHFSNEHLTLRFFSIMIFFHYELFTLRTLSWRTLGKRTLSFELLPYKVFLYKLLSGTPTAMHSISALVWYSCREARVLRSQVHPVHTLPQLLKHTFHSQVAAGISFMHLFQQLQSPRGWHYYQPAHLSCSCVRPASVQYSSSQTQCLPLINQVLDSGTLGRHCLLGRPFTAGL